MRSSHLVLMCAVLGGLGVACSTKGSTSTVALGARPEGPQATKVEHLLLTALCNDAGGCPDGLVCGTAGCQLCQADVECGSGSKCCAGRCTEGDSCPNCAYSKECGPGFVCGVSHDPAKRGMVCQPAPKRPVLVHASRVLDADPPLGASCSAHVDCHHGELCCDGSCVAGDCCDDTECQGRVCEGHTCQACTSTSDCGEGSVCCTGLCTAGQCCSDAQCADGEICRDQRCRTCKSDVECGDGKVCCGGSCHEGECPVDFEAHRPETQVDQFVKQEVPAPRTTCSTNSQCPGEVCCNGSCVDGNCCDSSQCASPLSCIQNVCQSCESNTQCGVGSVCCNGACNTGECCPGAACPNGNVCNAYQCAACTSDTECSTGSKCCGGSCVQGNCCSTTDCGQYLCTENWCSACTADYECGANGKCCGGACVTTGTCCSDSDCSNGKVCTNHTCGACSVDTDCGFDSKCCGGVCAEGNCCSTADCPNGGVCNSNHTCSSCSSDSQCAGGQKCCDGTCLDATCCSNSDCPTGKTCANNSCTQCTSSGQCGVGELCCNGGCLSGVCCVPTGASPAVPQCNGLVCLGNSCVQCTTDTECGTNSKCCNGACYGNTTCCSNTDCATGLETCVSEPDGGGGKCQGCSSNAQCGGGEQCCTDLPNGQPNRCAAFCSITQAFNNSSLFAPGTTLPDGGSTGTAVNDAGQLVWAGTSITENVPYIWISNTNEGVINRINTETGEIAGPYPTGVNFNWPATPGTYYGEGTSRTAVNVFDATVWVGNRDLVACRDGCESGVVPRSGAAHLDYNGNMLCYAPVPDVVRSVALDAVGNAWVGSFDTGTFYEFSGTSVNASSSPPACTLLQTVTIPSCNPYGAAVDQDGILWAQCCNGTMGSINTVTGQAGPALASGCAQYGMTVDQEYIWVGCYGTNNVSRITKSTGAVLLYNTGGYPRGLSSDGKNFVYASSWDGAGQVFKLNRNATSGNDFTTINFPGSSGYIIEAALDSAGNLWAVDYYGQVVRMNTDGSDPTAFTLAAGQYVYSDVTGLQEINEGLTPGLWSVIYDSQYPNPDWTSLNITANLPPGTALQAEVRVGPSVAALPNAAWSTWIKSYSDGGFPGPPNLTPLGLPGTNDEFIQIQLELITQSQVITPAVSNLSVSWAPF